jgi:hypothetical protein
MKVCIIAIARQENLYINEWVNYHLNLGVDNIIVCDNNDTNERVSDIIKNNRVITLSYNNEEEVQPKPLENILDRNIFEVDQMLIAEDIVI